ncbi:ribosomal protein S18-alanine N-acetyltransferase [Ornithinimicrobium sp. Y1847]|uniref:ribosomal protein S18-alanine N-acetyltransferase n=1 Tax=Ornithinimicrobium sp. Y1847 TaxID=3405419 RepID=UPI003B66C6D6
MSARPGQARVRSADWRDLGAMAELEARAFPQDPWSAATFWAELAARPRRDYVVLYGDLEEGQRLIGYAGLDLAGETADVMTVAVDPDRRGEGLGRVLLTELHQRAARSGAASVLLEVRADNAAARGLYAQHGYAELHRRRGYYPSAGGAPPVDALVLQAQLEREHPNTEHPNTEHPTEHPNEEMADE